MKTGIELITEERQEQIKKHGFNSDHDRQFINGELLEAAMYAITESDEYSQPGLFDDFEMNIELHRHDDLRNLIVAGALIAAEIDRIQNGNKEV